MLKRMKLNRAAILAVLIAALAAAHFGAHCAPAHAGVSEKVVASDASFDNAISGRIWRVLGNVNHEKGAIVFDGQGNASSQIVSTVRVNNLSDMGVDECVNGEVTLKINALGGEFYVAFGIDQAFKSMRSGTCSAISFYRDGESFKIKTVNIDRETTSLIEDFPAYYPFGSNIRLAFSVRADGKLFLSVNGSTAVDYDNALPFETEGYFGFAQSATSEVKITSANVYTGVYDSPKNANVDESFDDGTFDASRIFTNNNDSAAGYYKPEGVYCKDGVLKFENVTSYGFVSTCYEFSNFEMTFDMPHLQREFVYGENGEVITPASEFIGISVGAEQKNNSHIAITESVFMYFRNVKYVEGKPTKLYCVLLDHFKVLDDKYLSGGDDFWSLENAYDFYGKEKTVVFNIKMIDGVFTCAFKWAGESDDKYREVMRYDFGYTPYGFVQIHGQGSGAGDIAKNDGLTCSNFHIDNLKIINKDAVPATIEPDYVSNKIDMGEDYDYLDTWDYRSKTIKAITETESGGGCGAGINASGFALCAFALTIAVAMLKARGKSDEK